MEKMSNLLKYIAPVFILGVFTLIVSCEDDDETVINDTNLVFMQGALNGAEFKDGAQEVLTNVDISLIFSHEMETARVQDALTISGGNGASDFTVGFTNTNSTLQITSSNELDYETAYTIALPAGAYGTKGEELRNDFSISFTTEAFTPPQVSLSANAIEIEENAGVATITASLDKPADQDVTVEFSTGGMAVVDTDYILDPVSLVIPAGNLEATATVTAKLDSEDEMDEEIIIGIASVTNAEENGTQQLSILIKEQPAPLMLKGVMAMTWDGQVSTNEGKAVHLYANENIADLSIYGLGIANNGGGTDGQEYTFPAISVAAGDHILVARETAPISTYFGGCINEFDHVLMDDTGSVSQNGDDAIELFSNGEVIETYGDANVDGTGMDWEYSGSWAYKFDGEWITGGLDCTVGSSTAATSACQYPLCGPSVELKGVTALIWDGQASENDGKTIHLKVKKDVDDLSIYGVGTANNGGGTDGVEFILPAVSAKEGDDILIVRDQAAISAYYGNCINNFEIIITDGVANQNGNDAVELFENGVAIDVFGDVTFTAEQEANGLGWEYQGSWAYKVDGIWTLGGIGCAAGSTTNQGSSCPYPACQ